MGRSPWCLVLGIWDGTATVIAFIIRCCYSHPPLYLAFGGFVRAVPPRKASSILAFGRWRWIFCETSDLADRRFRGDPRRTRRIIRLSRLHQRSTRGVAYRVRRRRRRLNTRAGARSSRVWLVVASQIFFGRPPTRSIETNYRTGRTGL